MRFATRYDTWMVCVLIGVTALSVGSIWLAPAKGRAAFAFADLLAPATFVVVLAFTLPQYYEVREEGLFIRQGFRKILIPWASLTELTPTSDNGGAPVFSTDRLRVVGADNSPLIIAVADEEGFLDAVAAKCPSLVRRNGGLCLPFFS